MKNARLEQAEEIQEGQFFKTQDRFFQPTKKEKKFLEATIHQEIALCKFKTGEFQVLNELDFSHLIMKRRVTSVWAAFDFIQAYIKPNKNYPSFLKADFDFSIDSQTEIYKRAKRVIYYLKEERPAEIKGFDASTEEDFFEDELLKRNIHEYCKYLNCKLVCYLDAYYATRIKFLVNEYICDEAGLVHLANSSRIQFFNPLETQDYILREIHIVNEQDKLNALGRLPLKKKGSSHIKDNLLRLLQDYYEEVKDRMGIEKAFKEPSLENPLSNEAFRELNSETMFTLYDVMTDSEHFEKFKDWLKNRKKLENNSNNVAEKLQVTSGPESKSSSRFQHSHRRLQSSTTVATEKSPRHQDFEKAFVKKIKALDICGNGVSKKNLELSEIQYRFNLHSGRSFVAATSPKLSQQSQQPPKSPTQQSNLKRVSKGKNKSLQIDLEKTKPLQSHRSPRSALGISPSSNLRSLTSIIYLKSQNPNV